MGWFMRGASGVVTDDGARDTDEFIKTQAPVYTKYISSGIRSGRLKLVVKILKKTLYSLKTIYPSDDGNYYPSRRLRFVIIINR